ncbi:MAG: CvpA family protein [Lachnospiraceae bacterium]
MNLVLILVIIVLACCAVRGCRKGMVEEIVSILSLLVGMVAISLIVSAIGNYLDKHISKMLMALILFLLLLIITQIARVVIASLKFVSKIPIIHGVNKLAGLLIGIAEGVILVWAVFLIFEKFNLGGLGTTLMIQIEANSFLTFLYQQNYIKILFHL